MEDVVDIGGANDQNIAGIFFVDNLKIWNVAKTDFSDRFIDGVSCRGFEPPVDDPSTPVQVTKKNRALPFTAVLADGQGTPRVPGDLGALPVIQVLFAPGTSEAVNITDQVLAEGQGTRGNQFEPARDGKWQFNLRLNEFTARGTYTVTMVAGAASYLIAPACQARFVIK